MSNIFNDETYKQMEKDGLSKETIESIKEMKQEDIEIHENESNYKAISDAYNLSDDDISVLLKVIDEYKTTKEIKGLYNKLPTPAKSLASNILVMSIGTPIKMGKDTAAKEVLEMMINDAKFDNTFTEYNNALAEVINSANKDFGNLVNDEIEDIFSKIEELEKSNPDKANELREIKDSLSLADALSIEPISVKKINKAYSRYEYEFASFNKKFNNNPFGIAIPDLNGVVLNIMKRTKFNKEVVIKLLLIIVLSTYTRQSDSLVDIAYIYRMIDNFQMVEITNDEEFVNKVILALNETSELYK